MVYIEKLMLEDFLSGDEWFYVHRDIVSQASCTDSHRHNFAEIFLVEAGCGTHYLNDKEYPLRSGQVWILSPRDVHRLATKQRLRIMNWAFPAESLTQLSQRYTLSDLGTPPVRSPDPDVFNQLVLLGERLSVRRRSLLFLENFLMQVLMLWDDTARFAELSLPSGGPEWISGVPGALENPDVLEGGVEGLADFFGKTREYLSREVKKHYGRSPSVLLSEARAVYAKQLLSMTALPLVDVAARCGFESLSQFYKIFKRSTGTSPGRYRKISPW